MDVSVEPGTSSKSVSAKSTSRRGTRGTDNELLSFVREALMQGVPRTQIEDALLQAGWKAEQVKSALSAFAEIEFPIPVPRPKPYLSAREAFLYLVLFSTLYISAYNFGALIFQGIDSIFPDPAVPADSEYILESIRWSVASLVIAFPVFLYVSRLLNRDIKQDQGIRSSKVRKWLTYVTLFIMATAIIGNLIALVYNFLAGELTIRFLLKFITVVIIAGTIFWYYLRDLRREESEINT